MAWYSFAFWSAIIVILASIAYDQVTRRIVTRLRAEQAPRSEFGIVRINGFGSYSYGSGVDIIFVHGLGSNPDTTWTTQTQQFKSTTTDQKTPVSWISDFLPQDFPPTLRDHTRVFLYNHDSYWQRDAIQTRLWRLGEGLLHRIRTDIRNTEEERERDLVFVGHSYGGLIIKQALIHARRNEDFADVLNHTNTVLFLGTPHFGSEAIKWATITAKALQPLGSNPDIIRPLAFDSVPIRDLHRDFVAIAKERIRIVNFYETRPIRVAKFWFVQWDVFAVGENSATYDGPSVQNIGLAVDHFRLNKFGTNSADEYNVVKNKLLEPLKKATSCPHTRYSVPLKTARTYVDRDKLSSALKGILNAERSDVDSPHTLIIHGLGGTGKTQLVLKYIEDHKGKYDPVLWIDAKDPSAVYSSFERCVDELQLHVEPTSAAANTFQDSRTIQAILRMLTARKTLDRKWLVVIDGADDFSWGIRAILPPKGWGDIIVTSQDNQAYRLSPNCEQVSVDVMHPSEARTILFQHFGLELDSVSENVLLLCDKVTKHLGNLPLAVELAGAYIGTEADKEAALIQYLVDYKSHKDDLLRQNYFRGLSDAEKTIWTVWDQTLNRIRDLQPGTRPDLLLAFLARFRGSAVPDELFRLGSIGFLALKKHFGEENEPLPSWLNAWTQLNEEQWDDFHYRTARDLLLRYSLVQRAIGDWPGVTMHNLVQWRATKYEENLPWDIWHLNFIAAACSQSKKELGGLYFRQHMIPHVLENTLETVTLGLNDHQKDFIGHNVGIVLADGGRWTEAEKLLVQVSEIRQRVLGEEHPDTLTSVNNLASTYWHQGRWKEAEELEMQVVKTSQKVLGQEHPDTLTSINNLTLTYWDQGRWKEAEELEMRVMKTRQKVLGQEHPDTLISMNNLAFTLKYQSRDAEAISLMRRCCKLRGQVLGPSHPDTETSLEALHTWKSDQDELERSD